MRNWNRRKEMKDLWEVIRTHDLAGLKAFLVEHPRGLDVEAPDGAWAMQEVMRQGDLEMAEYVVEYAIVNLNLVDRMGNTALHYAVESGNLELVTYLVERVGLSAIQANLEGETPLEKAARLGLGRIQAYFEKTLGCALDGMYKNPVYRGMHPDPSIVRVGEDYYMVNSSFMFFPCIPISHSRDLVHWEVIGHAITRPDWAGLKGLEGGRGYWAPDISYYEGRFYVTATYRLNEGGMPQRLQMVTSAEKPEGPYCEPVFLDEDGIDPSIFTDLDGRRYMLLNRGARIFEISADGREILSKAKLLWYGDNKKASEGPHMLYKDGYYYLFMAEGGTGTGHRISVARSRTLMGVYESCPYNPILRQWDEKKQLQCCGHGMPVETPEGDWYMVYLCSRPGVSGRGILGRETALDPITWTADGWPIVNSLRGPSDLQRMPAVGAGCRQDARQNLAVDGGAEHKASVFDPEKGAWGDWFTVRGTEPGRYEADAEKIRIQGSGSDLNTLEYGTVLLQSQKDFCFEVSCGVRLEEEAACGPDEGASWDMGLTCYYDENSYLKLGICRREERFGILAAEYVDDRYITEQFLPLEDSLGAGSVQAELCIETEHMKRSGYYRLPGQEWKPAAVFEDTRYLSSGGLKKGKRFTGAAAGIYVNGSRTGGFSGFAMRRLG